MSTNSKGHQAVSTMEMEEIDSLNAMNDETVEVSSDGIFDVECIRPYIDIQFPKYDSKRAKLQLIYSFISIYILSFIDIISDILLAINVSSDSCIYNLYKKDERVGAFYIIITFLWISAIWAIINTIMFKYVASYKTMKKHDLSYWNAMKFVAIYTELKCNMDYSSFCNKYQGLRLLAVILEDFFSLFVAIVLAYVTLLLR